MKHCDPSVAHLHAKHTGKSTVKEECCQGQKWRDVLNRSWDTGQSTLTSIEGEPHGQPKDKKRTA